MLCYHNARCSAALRQRAESEHPRTRKEATGSAKTARRAAEKEKSRNGKREDGSESKHANRERNLAGKTRTAAGNASVKLDAGSKGKLAKNRLDETRGLQRGPKKEKKTGTDGAKKPRKANTQLGKESGRKNREPQLGTPMSSLMQVQKENSPKTVQTRPAASKEALKSRTRHGRPEEASKSKHATRKGFWQKKPGTAARNANVKFDADSKENSPKTVQSRPAALSEEAPKRRKPGTDGAKKPRKANTQPGKKSERTYRAAGNVGVWDKKQPQLETPVSSLMQIQKENSPKTVRTRPAALEEAPKRKKSRNRQRENG